MKFSIALLLATAGMGRASADPLADLEQVRAAYGALHSVHAEITMSNGMDVSIDWIEPDKMHVVSSQNGMQMIAIGNNHWVNMGGHWTALPPEQPDSNADGDDDLWIVNRLPVKAVEYGKAAEQEATITYSRYNGVPDFGPPT